MKNEDRRQNRMTRQRKTILKVLGETKSHPTADELYQMVRRHLPRISLGTVYRNLDVLCNQGLVKQLEVGGAQRRYDAITERHWHARCIRCGHVFDAPEAVVTPVEVRNRADFDFTITDYRLELLGVCGLCRGRERRGEATVNASGSAGQPNDENGSKTI